MAQHGVVHHMATDINLILAELQDATHGSEGACLAEWIERYPEHSEALIEYSLESFVLDRAVNPKTDSAVEAELLHASRKAAFEALESFKEVPIKSILDTAISKGQSPQA